MTEVPDGSDPVALANWLFDLARQGDAARLAAYVDAGAPVDLTDAEGNTLLMLAAGTVLGLTSSLPLTEAVSIIMLMAWISVTCVVIWYRRFGLLSRPVPDLS